MLHPYSETKIIFIYFIAKISINFAKNNFFVDNLGKIIYYLMNRDSRINGLEYLKERGKL